MRKPLKCGRLQILIAGISAIALCFTVAAPHSHEHASVSHQASTCRACRIQEGFSATPATPALVTHQPIFVAVCSRRLVESPRITLVLRSSSPRAPPIAS